MRAEPRTPVAAPLQRLEVPLTEPEVERLWHGAGERRAQRRARRKIAVAGTVALAALALALGARGLLAAPEALRLADGRAATELVVEGAPVRFHDGSVVSPERGADLSVTASAPTAIDFVQRDGRARYDVVPGGGRTWRIRCGSATVEVLGTAFVLERDERTLHVRVERGLVRVTGPTVPGSPHDLSAGESLSVDAYPPSVVTEAGDDAPALEAPAVETSPSEAIIAPELEASPSVTPPRARSGRPSPPSWRALAEAGAWDAAYASLGESGVLALGGDASVEELLLLSDVCRRSRHPREAAVLLERIVDEHPSDPNAALAAFSLGRIELERLHRPDRAVRALERALALGLPSGLVADAEARLEEARIAAREPSHE